MSRAKKSRSDSTPPRISTEEYKRFLKSTKLRSIFLTDTEVTCKRAVWLANGRISGTELKFEIEDNPAR